MRVKRKGEGKSERLKSANSGRKGVSQRGTKRRKHARCSLPDNEIPDNRVDLVALGDVQHQLHLIEHDWVTTE